MADWTAISNANVEPDAPFISATAFALRDNPIAIAEGAAGAPRIVYAALSLSNDLVNSDVANGTLGAEKFQTGTSERDWVLARTATLVEGTIGTHAILRPTTNIVETYTFGETRGSSDLEPSSVANSSGGFVSGTWRCLGLARDSSGSGDASLWVRIS